MDNLKNIIEKNNDTDIDISRLFLLAKTVTLQQISSKCKKWHVNWKSTSVSVWSKFTWVLYDDNLYVVFSTSVTDVNIRVYVFYVVLLYMFLPYVIIGVNTSSLKMVSLVKCGMWEIGGQQLWEVGDWGLKYVVGGRLASLFHPPPPLDNSFIKSYHWCNLCTKCIFNWTKLHVSHICGGHCEYFKLLNRGNVLPTLNCSLRPYIWIIKREKNFIIQFYPDPHSSRTIYV